MRIHHIAMRTRDLDRLRRFYTEFLELDVIDDRPGRVWLRAGEAILMLEEAEPDEPEIPANCKEFVAFTIAANEKPVWRNSLQQACLPYRESDYTLYFRDPDGRSVGLSCFTLPS